jgi:hypothetical protein
MSILERMTVDLSGESISPADITDAEMIAIFMGLNSESTDHAQKAFISLVADAMQLWGVEPVDGEIPVSVRLGAAMIMRECGHELILPPEYIDHPSLKGGNLINPRLEQGVAQNG